MRINQYAYLALVILIFTFANGQVRLVPKLASDQVCDHIIDVNNATMYRIS